LRNILCTNAAVGGYYFVVDGYEGRSKDTLATPPHCGWRFVGNWQY